jgi:hypothetical protein
MPKNHKVRKMGVFALFLAQMNERTFTLYIASEALQTYKSLLKQMTYLKSQKSSLKAFKEV